MNMQGSIVVALFPIDQPGLYVVSVSGATAVDHRQLLAQPDRRG